MRPVAGENIDRASLDMTERADTNVSQIRGWLGVAGLAVVAVLAWTLDTGPT